MPGRMPARATRRQARPSIARRSHALLTRPGRWLRCAGGAPPKGLSRVLCSASGDITAHISDADRRSLSCLHLGPIPLITTILLWLMMNAKALGEAPSHPSLLQSNCRPLRVSP